MRKHMILAVALTVTFGLGGIAFYFRGAIAETFKHLVMARAPEGESAKQWFMCGMDHHIQDHPGPCDLCGMLVEPLKPHSADLTGIVIDPVIIQNMGVRVAKVSEGELRTTLRTVGTLTEPEQNHTEVNLRVGGWIQKLYANIEGMSVMQGDPLFDLYSPELTADADELIATQKSLNAMRGDDAMKASTQSIVNAARRKLMLTGLTEAQIDEVAKADKAPATFAILSPKTGHVAEKMVVEGAAVKAGDRVMLVADRSTMWLQVQIFERQLPLVPIGTPIRANFAAAPGETFEGKVEFIYPHLDMMTRTAKVRVVLNNHDHRLHEGMYATVDMDVIIDAKAMQVPREAVIDSGTRQMVFISDGGGHFSPRKVEIGPMGHPTGTQGADEMVQILSGLTAGETVVTSGQFLLDSESRTEEAIQKHLTERLLAKQGTTTQPATQAAGHNSTTPASDAMFTAYMQTQRQLGTVGATAVNPAIMIAAAEKLQAQAHDDAERAIAARILQSATALRGQSLSLQRGTFKSVSLAIIDLTDHVQVSAAVAPTLVQFHCLMTKADWIQDNELVANPFTDDNMKTCGDIVRRIPTAATMPAMPEGGIK